MNSVNLLGRLTDNPEVKAAKSGGSVLRFRIAVDRPVSKDKERKADFISCVAWNSTAEFINRYFVKGSPIAITGSLRTSQYPDSRHSDVTHYVTEVNVDKAFFAGSKAAQSNSAQNDQHSYSQSSYSKTLSSERSSPSPAVPADLDDFEEIISGDDVPF